METFVALFFCGLIFSALCIVQSMGNRGPPLEDI